MSSKSNPEIASAVAQIVASKSTLPRVAFGGAEMLQRHWADEEPAELAKAMSFDDAYRRMAAPGQVWAACDALSSVIWDILYDEDEEGKLDVVDKTVDSFKTTPRGILSDAGVAKRTPPGRSARRQPAAPVAERRRDPGPGGLAESWLILSDLVKVLRGLGKPRASA